MNAFAQALDGLRVISDDADADRDRALRKEQLMATWERVPRGMHKFSTSPKFERAIAEWQPGTPMVLLGPTGAGKTSAVARLVALLCRNAADQGGDVFALARSIFWVRADELTSAGGAERDESASKLMLRSEMCRLLVLDDVASSSKTLLRILQRRYDGRREVIVTAGARNAVELATTLGGHAPLRWILEGGKQPGKVVIA
jgi:hypothetical protein